MQPPTELIFAFSRDRLACFPFLGTVLDRTSAIRVDFHSINKWLSPLDQSILLPNPHALSQPLGGSTEEQLWRKSVAQQQLSSWMASYNPSAILTTDQIKSSDPPPTMDWDSVLGSIELKELKQISLHETNIDGRQLALFMNRATMESSLKAVHLIKTDLKGQDVEGLRRAIDERTLGRRLVV
ncbi:hypothetical protein BGZ47_007608 [Haplosporangium gracile]|nr:hypothetical protein BGZ47_007608 [Haplosporangium gracile]